MEVVVSEIDKSGKHNVIHCKPFDYEKLPGNRVVKEIVVNKSKDSVRCNIVVSNTLVRGKKVRFFKNGRCINHVSDVKSFMSGSTHKAKLWEHPSVCGFIEVGNTLEPVITRQVLSVHCFVTIKTYCLLAEMSSPRMRQEVKFIKSYMQLRRSS